MDADIKTSLLEICSYSQEELEAFIHKLESRRLKKKEHLLEPGKVCNFITFIQKGSLRLFTHEAENEQTLLFFTEGMWVADYESFVVQKPSTNYLEATEECHLLTIGIYEFHSLLPQYPRLQMLARLMSSWVVPNSHLISLTKKSPDERYRELMHTHPDWINRFAQMHIASYLGMTPETLSRTRSRFVLIS